MMKLDLPKAWTEPRTTAGLHLLRAHRANTVVILRRKPSKLCHLIKWNTETDEIEHGSWFRGQIDLRHCDLSWDGTYTTLH